MAASIHIPRSYGFGLALSLMFQISAWVMCFFNGSLYGPAEVSGGFLLNWRAWFLSVGTYWFSFLALYLTRRENPSVWRVIYVALSFPALFITAAYLVPRFFGVN